MRFLTYIFQTAPQDVKTLMWILLGGASGVIGYLYISKERQKEKEQERYDRLLSDFNNYKDKTIDERVEMAEKMIVAVNAFKQGLEDMPEKVVSKSLDRCRVNLERLISKERDGKN